MLQESEGVSKEVITVGIYMDRIEKPAKPFTIRKLSKSGNSRSMSIGTILPPNWVAVKVIILGKYEGVIDLRLEQIK